jgi:hypothetical protein
MFHIMDVRTAAARSGAHVHDVEQVAHFRLPGAGVFFRVGCRRGNAPFARRDSHQFVTQAADARLAAPE